MKIKIYHDKTYNIFFEEGDYVKVKKDNDFGKVLKVIGRPITAKLIIETDKGQIEHYVWDVVPVTEEGIDITQEQLFKMIPVTESFDISNNTDNKIIKFNEFN
jgi:hypothetical protein